MATRESLVVRRMSLGAFLWFITTLVYAATPPPPPPPPPSAHGRTLIGIGEVLRTNEYLVSVNKGFFAVMQSDGNFCVYKGSGPNDNRGFLWCSMVTAGGGGFYATQQSDGNSAPMSNRWRPGPGRLSPPSGARIRGRATACTTPFSRMMRTS